MWRRSNRGGRQFHAGSGHPIDRILGKYFADHKVSPPPLLDDAAFARRVYLDLIGLLAGAKRTQCLPCGRLKGQAGHTRASIIDRKARIHRPLAGVLERPVAQRLQGHRLHRRRPQADHRLALSIAARQQAIRPVRPRTPQPDPRIRRICKGHPLAGPSQCQPAGRIAIRPERRPGVLWRQLEMRFVPRQLHRSTGSSTTPTAWPP